ncbi:hypothetical protein GQX74_008773 [Glossina fuscipes]|nr:hypothetical protein GQX74_008773 [Glossina fuscipes]
MTLIASECPRIDINYGKRKLLQEITIKSFILCKGPEYAKTLTKLETDLTIDMMANALWKDWKFKAYNFNTLGAPPSCGLLHPLLKVRSEFRQIFLEMRPYVKNKENSFTTSKCFE